MSIYRLLRFFLTPLQRILWPTKIVHRENFHLAKDGAIFICNHYSTPDSIILASHFFKKELNVLVKSDAFKNKTGAMFLRKFGCIPVKRGEPDIEAYKKVMQILNDNRDVLIFPEGTRNKDGSKELAPFKNGVASFALKSKKPIVPMLYYQMHKVFRRNYLIIGEPFNLVTEGFDRRHLNDATVFVTNKMNELRSEIDEIVERGKK